MQFHLNGFRAGDPEVSEPGRSGKASNSDSLTDDVDVLIVGCGPAGLTLAAYLSAFPDINTRIVEQKPGPLRLGQADGIACRTMEMFEAFGFCERVLKEAHWVNETTFWKPDDNHRERIVRHGRIQDVEEGLSEFPHVVLNQARVHDFYLNLMRNAPSRLEPSYSRRLLDLRIDPQDASGGAAIYPVTVKLQRVDHEEQIETIRARYVVGCDGARSSVRRSLGRELQGDSANHIWGVMDVLAVTDFPDIRLKSLIQSADLGNIVLIPREGGYLVRVYVELGELHENERVSDRNITLDRLLEATQRILHPYAFEVKETAWWSVYEIGQRLCDRFDDVPDADVATRLPRVFIAGDACHTHSPKAGLGMNVSMQDAFNLGWKLASVLRGRCLPQILHTYSRERQGIAKELIDFDREWASMLTTGEKSSDAGSQGADPAEVQNYFVRHGHYTAGTATEYKPSIISGEPAYQHLAKGLAVGTRFHSAPVIRLADAKRIHLGHTVKADGRWRIFAFSDREDPPSSRIRALCDFLEQSPESPVRRHTPPQADVDSVIDVRAVFQQSHRALRLEDMPTFLLPRKGRYGLRDYEKMFCPDLKGGDDIFDMRGIDRERGCLVIVRPDQYVAHVLPLDAYEELSAFFRGFMCDG
ncbi:MAG: FAD-binding monooxygenase [Candidatus Eremiobacteraeota bacterium]|nr:FAD-binding monooxygenase [Candidatus Eremiobacteraeota bacterium]